MTSNILELITTVQTAANKINDTQKFAVAILANKARKAALERPNDQTLRVMSNVLSKMNENGKIFISRGEFRSLYSKFASNRNEAQNIFANELDPEEQKPDRPLAGQKVDEKDLKLDLYEGADPLQANSLNSLWDDMGAPVKNGIINEYLPEMARQAEMLTNLELSRIGYAPKAISTYGGTPDFIICDAKYETPQGEAHILVPVELSSDGALIPTLFISKFGAVDLGEKEVLRKHILSSAGKAFSVNATQLIEALNTAKGMSTLSEFEIMALAAQDAVNRGKGSQIAKQASEYKMVYSGASVLGQEVNKYNPETAMLPLPKAKEFDKFASLLSTGKGLAELTFSKATVESGRDVIISKMASFGYHSQVSVASATKDSIIYAVGINSSNGPLGFEVIAEVNNNRVNIPTVAAIKDKAFDFTQDGIDNIVQRKASDPSMLAMVSPLYGLKPSDLLNTIREAADNRNYKIAEDALNVLANTADENTYTKALAEYLRSLNKSEISKEASEKKCGCSMIVRVSTHSGPVCGHLNMPLDKVYQNERGECLPKYRKNISDTYEGVLFNTSKIFQ